MGSWRIKKQPIIDQKGKIAAKMGESSGSRAAVVLVTCHYTLNFLGACLLCAFITYIEVKVYIFTIHLFF